MQTITPAYEFGTLVRGEENLLAVSGAMKVLADPGERYNPLFIHGPPSSGKTHLLYALRTRFESIFPNGNILALPASEFIEECEQAWRDRSSLEWRQQLWKLDVLLIDDVHLFINRPAPLEEIYHAYNRLVADSRQIILTSRFAPAEMTDLPFTLRSRFQSGLVVGLEAPRDRLLRDILEHQSQARGIRVSRKAANYLCRELRSPRELQGILNIVSQENNGKAHRLSLSDARDLLEQHAPRRLALADIARAVCKHFQIDLAKVCSVSRRQSLVQARQLAMYLMRELTNAPLTEIGRFFGGRDHTTVLYACKKVEEEVRMGGFTTRAAREIQAALRQ